ncbi:hypothetical protein EGW08_001685, partial [Elysia chlorotica]
TGNSLKGNKNTNKDPEGPDSRGSAAQLAEDNAYPSTQDIQDGGSTTEDDNQTAPKEGKVSTPTTQKRSSEGRGHGKSGKKQRKKSSVGHAEPAAILDNQKTVRIDDANPRTGKSMSRKEGRVRRHFAGWDGGKELAEHTMTSLPQFTDIAALLLQHEEKMRRREALLLAGKDHHALESIETDPKLYLARHGIQEMFTDFTSSIMYDSSNRPVDLIVDTVRKLDTQGKTKTAITDHFPFLKSEESKERIRFHSAKGELERAPSEDISASSQGFANTGIKRSSRAERIAGAAALANDVTSSVSSSVVEKDSQALMMQQRLSRETHSRDSLLSYHGNVSQSANELLQLRSW